MGHQDPKKGIRISFLLDLGRPSPRPVAMKAKVHRTWISLAPAFLPGFVGICRGPAEEGARAGGLPGRSVTYRVVRQLTVDTLITSELGKDGRVEV